MPVKSGSTAGSKSVFVNIDETRFLENMGGDVVALPDRIIVRGHRLGADAEITLCGGEIPVPYTLLNDPTGDAGFL